MKTYFISNNDSDFSILDEKVNELILDIPYKRFEKDAALYYKFSEFHPNDLMLKNVMDINFNSNLNLEEYAKLCYRSLSTFKRDFKRIYKTSPGKWILYKRLSNSMYLMKHYHKTVSEAAFESGFESLAHFSRTFRQHFGVSPTTIRSKRIA